MLRRYTLGGWYGIVVHVDGGDEEIGGWYGGPVSQVYMSLVLAPWIIEHGELDWKHVFTELN